MSEINKLIENIGQDAQKGKILLIGDIMLDQYVKGSVSRISPEGPIPVFHVSNENHVLGGVGNVLANLASLKVDSFVISLVGDDENGHLLSNIITASHIPTDGLIKDKDRPTITKTRYVSQNQQLLRVDREDSAAISNDLEKKILSLAEKQIHDTAIMVLSDYGKGVLTPSLIQSLIALARQNDITVLVDPKGNDYSIYKGATILTPNRKELSEATHGMATRSDDDIEQAAQKLIDDHDIEYVFATRSEDGISVIPKKGSPTHLRTKSIEVYDVSGAGDTVVAVTAAVLAAGGDLIGAAKVANIAGAIVVSKSGTATVTKNEISQYINKNTAKLLEATPRDLAKDQIKKWQEKGLKVGMTGGCFDIIHYGHVNYLAKAKEKCDRLVVCLNHDASVRILKGETRPINDQNARASVIAALSSVDMVVFFGAEKPEEDNTPSDIIAYLQPDILMKGGDYTVDQLPEGKIVLSYGGQVEIMPLYEGYSTTNIIEKSKS